jgi:hypothetical protein
LAIIGYLKTGAQVAGYPCRADWIHFSKNWDLKLFRLSGEATINDFKYPKDAWIRFTDDRAVICVFPQATRVQGYLCKGGVFSLIGLHESGNLKQCNLDQAMEINGIRYKKNTKLFLDENGRIKTGK